MQFSTIFAAAGLIAAVASATVSNPPTNIMETRSHSKRAIALAEHIFQMEKRGQSKECTLCTFGCATGPDLDFCDCCTEDGSLDGVHVKDEQTKPPGNLYEGKQSTYIMPSFALHAPSSRHLIAPVLIVPKLSNFSTRSFCFGFWDFFWHFCI
ncbi:hypothetical protein DM02DRAFT_653587 [Periconia macrospinosa]|uniref:ZZ-type domain-containing protein n=1 Tax=Periconia macrospinosa TaxID=97972 RepID=A0A2V1DVS0_9PLEO|nr:hypothetical protein DM02DRAFT_653587 [Periconia macrospinosa]